MHDCFSDEVRETDNNKNQMEDFVYENLSMSVDIENFKVSFDLVSHVQNSLEHRVYGAGVLAKCPFHDDSIPSMMVNKDRWYCFSCGFGGDAIDYLIKTGAGRNLNDVLSKSGFASVVQSLPPKPKEKKIRTVCPPSESMIRIHHNALMSSPEKLEYILSRGVSVDSANKYMLGYGKPWPTSNKPPRYTIPIFDRNGSVITVKYRVDRDIDNSEEKYLSHPGSELYPFNTSILSDNEWVVFCGGQIDAILLNQYGIPAVSPPSEGVFKAEWAKMFVGKKVYVLLDNDNAGRCGTDKVTSIIPGAVPVYWPRCLKRGYDVNDAILDEGMGINGIIELLAGVERGKRAIDSWGDQCKRAQA